VKEPKPDAKPLAIEMSETAKVQLMAMSPEDKDRLLEALADIAANPGKGIPFTDFLDTLGPEERAEWEERARGWMREVPD
jgi:hypothetical protein